MPTPAGPEELRAFVQWHAPTYVSDLNLNSSVFVGYSDNRIATTRMAMDIGQTLLIRCYLVSAARLNQVQNDDADWARPWKLMPCQLRHDYFD
jgi:hypothetical protein